jgi:excisionase family DNA binding protein
MTEAPAPDSEIYMTFGQAAARLQWHIKTLRRALAKHGITAIGRGRRARLSEADLQRVIAAERRLLAAAAEHQPLAAHPAIGAKSNTAGRSPDGALRSQRRRRIAKAMRAQFGKA